MGAAELQERKTELATYVAQGEKRDECINILAIMSFYNKVSVFSFPLEK